MKNFINTKNILMLATAISVVGASSAYAETITGNGSVVVQNSLTIVEDTPLSFGTIVAVADDNGTAPLSSNIVMGVDGVATITNAASLAQIIQITPGSNAQFTVSGAAPQTLLTVTTPAGATTLADPSGSVETKVFDISAYTSGVVAGGGAGFDMTTDDTGTLVFAVGATLTTDTAGAGTGAADPYADLTYTGTYSVTVAY